MSFRSFPQPLTVAALAALALLVAASCGDPSGGPRGTASAGRGGSGSAAGGELIPDVDLKTVDGREVKLSDFDGQVRLIDFWATWCAPCREEVPMFKDLHAKYGDKGFKLLAVSMDDGPGVVREFVAEYDIPYLNLMGDDEVGERFGGVLGLPMAFLVDRDGRIVDRYLGAKPRKVLEKRVRELLGLTPESDA